MSAGEQARHQVPEAEDGLGADPGLGRGLNTGDVIVTAIALCCTFNHYVVLTVIKPYCYANVLVTRRIVLFGYKWLNPSKLGLLSPNRPKFSGKIFRKNTQTLCSKVMKSSARGLTDFQAIFAEPLWDDSGSGDSDSVVPIPGLSLCCVSCVAPQC